MGRRLSSYEKARRLVRKQNIEQCEKTVERQKQKQKKKEQAAAAVTSYR